MGFIKPAYAPLALGVLAFMVAFTSASQDIVIDAYRTDVLLEKERGIGAATFVLGYRIAMLVAGALALIMSDHIGWQNTYLIMAAIMVIGILVLLPGLNLRRIFLRTKKPQGSSVGTTPGFYHPSLRAFTMLLLIVLYKLGDAYAGTMTTTFLLRGAGFSATEVGTINKGMGLMATIIGAMFGGTLMIKLGLFRSLMLFGLFQMVSNLSFMVLAWLGKNYGVMIFAVAFENLCGGMGTSAFVALLMALCNKKYSATQFALLVIPFRPRTGFHISHFRLRHQSNRLGNVLLHYNPDSPSRLWLLWRMKGMRLTA